MDKAQYKVVPVEPTDSMVQAAHSIDLSYMPGQEGADRAAIYRAMLAAAPQPPSASGERDANIAELTELVLTPDEHGGHYFNHVEGCTECCDCAGRATGDDDDLQHKPDCPSITDEARHRRRLAMAYAIQAVPSPGIDAAEQKPVADGETSAILHWIMKQAEAAKEPCGDDPESRAAVRNSKLAAIASAAAQALGMVCGPSYAAPPAAQPSAEWLAEMERLVDEHAAAIATAAKYCGTPYQKAKDATRAALRAHLQARP